MRYDLHIHSKYSPDSISSPEKIFETAKKKGLSGIAVTDHNTIEGALRVREYTKDGFKVIIGEEISTNMGEIIGLFLEKEVKSRELHKAISEIKNQGGLIVVPHPFDRMWRGAIKPYCTDVKWIDAVEVCNAREVFRDDNLKAYRYAYKYDLSMVAGSDAHWLREIGNAGIEIENSNIREAILSKKTTIFGHNIGLVNLFNHCMTKTLKIMGK